MFVTAQVSNNENNRFTKDCIYEALWELLKQYPYNTITITQIANKAGVSRNAIYRNFESKDLIIKKRLMEIHNEFIYTLNNDEYSSYEEYISIVFNYLCAKKDIALVLVKANLSEFLIESFLYVKGQYKSDTKNNLYENYRIGGLLSVYLTWLLTDCKETPQELSSIVNHICTNPASLPRFNP